jgi:hypothetical protein
MPKRELKHPSQVEAWLQEWGSVLGEMPADWMQRASRKQYGLLEVLVPSMDDLLVPKLKRVEPRDKLHAEWAKKLQ